MPQLQLLQNGIKEQGGQQAMSITTLFFTKAKRAQNTEDYESWIEGGVMPTLNRMDNNGEAYATALIVDPIVRRLTPLECERLQGFPDNWTEGQADSNRYKQIGNAVAVPVVEWIISRMVADE
jgi:DNA (cytosine-5)-methyltransferase 1